MQYVVADPADERPVLHQPELLGLAAEFLLVCAGAGDDEAGLRQALDDLGQRLECELEALLVDQPTDEEDQGLVWLCELGAQPAQLVVVVGLQILRIDPVRDHLDPLLVDPEDVDHLLAHEGRADQHPVRAVRDPALDPVDVGLRMLVDPALMAAVLGRVDRRHQGCAEAPREVVAGVRDEPVVAVHDVELEPIAELDPGGEHVRVHPLDPGDELVELRWPGWLADPVHVDPVDELLGRGLLAAAGEHVDLRVQLHQALGLLADDARQAALDQWRVLPGKDQDSRLIRARGAAPG